MKTVPPIFLAIFLPIFLAAGLVFTVSAAPVQAQSLYETMSENLYVSGALGMTRGDKESVSGGGVSGKATLDSAVFWSAALGRRVTDNMRAEAELSYRSLGVGGNFAFGGTNYSLNGDLDALAVLANGYYDFMSDRALRPYVSAGLGFAHIDGKVKATGGGRTVSVSSTDTDLAWQIGAGVSYDVARKTSVFAGWRYLQYEEIGLEDGLNEFMIGIRYGF